MKSCLVKLCRIATSRTLVVWLIVAILGIALLGNIISQTPLPPGGTYSGVYPSLVIKIISFLKLNDIYSSYPFYIIIILLVFNLLYCMSGRVRFLFEDSAESGRFFSRTGLGLMGSLLFHLSIVVVIAGVVYDVSTRMKGKLIITQGQEVTESHDSYIHVDEAPLFLEKHSFFKMILKDVSIEFKNGVVVDMMAKMGIVDRNISRDYAVRVNQPLQYRSTMLVMQKYGFAPLVTLVNPEGTKDVDVYLSLAPRETRGSVEDFFKVPGTDMVLTIRLYPDAEIKDNIMIRTLTPELRAPKLVVQFDRHIDGGKIKERLFKGIINPGETVEFKGYKLRVGDIRYWVQFDVTREPGKKIVYTGFWMGVAGISLRLFLIFFQPIKDEENEVCEKIEKEKVVL